MNRKQLLNKFLANQCSAEEAKLVFSWLNENPKLLDDLISEDDWTSYIAQEKNVKRSNGNISKIFTVFVIFGLLFFCSNLFEERHGQIARDIIKKTYYNPLSRPKEIITDDESHLILAPGALVQVRINSNLDFRYVKVLEGKVQFEVAKDPSKPFIVESDQLTTTALGTQFIVNYTSRSKDVLVQLLEGRVRVAHIKQSAEHVKILKPGQQIHFSAASQMVLSNFGNNSKGADRFARFLPLLIEAEKEKEYRYPMTIHQSTNWLEMEETSLSEIIQYINHELDMPVSYDSLLVRNYRLKGRFRKNANMDLQDKTQLAESILQLIVEVNPFKLEKQQNTYILKPKK